MTIRVYQISLHGTAYDARGKTKKQIFEETGHRGLKDWRDPLLDRPMLSGEIGCAISHMRVWEQIANSGQSGIILEEDAVYEFIDTSAVEKALETHDSAWLGYRNNSLGYWYNAHAYAITSDTASYLLSQGFSQAMVPVDEYLPYALSGGQYGAYRGTSFEKKKNYFFDPPIVKQIERKNRASTIEGTTQMADDRIHLITVATEQERASKLLDTAAKFGWPITVLGSDDEWRDDMSGVGGFPKVEFVRKFLEGLEPDTIVMFMDGYDTFINDNSDTVLERFLGFGVDILFGAERYLWPDWDYSHNYPESHTAYRYLNSGQYIGRAGPLSNFMQEGDGSEGIDDQAFFHERFLWHEARFEWDGKINVALDYEGYIFQNHEPQVHKSGEQLFNPLTGCFPCTYHGNGGEYEKDVFESLYNVFNGEPVSLPFYNKLDYEIVADEILMTKLLSEAECKKLIQMSDDLGGWEQMDGDKFPAQEIRAKRLGIWDDLNKMWQDKLGLISEKNWAPMMHYGLRDAFTMRYSRDTQTALGLHTDASLVTGSIKLNDDYQGAELVFPRQDFSNIDVPVGNCILFPSQVTHGHKVEPLTDGVKYSLTMWTSRYNGDVN